VYKYPSICKYDNGANGTSGLKAHQKYTIIFLRLSQLFKHDPVQLTMCWYVRFTFLTFILIGNYYSKDFFENVIFKLIFLGKRTSLLLISCLL